MGGLPLIRCPTKSEKLKALTMILAYRLDPLSLTSVVVTPRFWSATFNRGNIIAVSYAM